MEKFKINLYKSIKKDPLSAFNKNELLYALFPNDNAVSDSIINNWQYEWYMFEFLLKNLINTEGKDIVDIGGNNGNFAVDFSHLVGDSGKVHSFEPQRIIYYQLCTNIFLNGLTNVYCHNTAIGDKDEVVQMEKPNYFSKDAVNFGAAEIVKDDRPFELVQSKRLDSCTFNDIVFIKIDVQGYESFIIDGAQETINKHRPYLFVEFEDHLLKKFGSSEAELQAKIESLGYVVKPFQPGISYQTESGKCLDQVCIPKEKWEEFEHIIP